MALPPLYDEVVINVLVKGDIFDCNFHGRTNNKVFFCEPRQYWREFIDIYNTQIPRVNVMKKVRWEGI